MVSKHNELKDALQRLATGTATGKDRKLLHHALVTEQVVHAVGKSSVAIGGDIVDSVVISGDIAGTVMVFKGNDASTLREELKTIVSHMPKLSATERDELDRLYLAEVVQKYQFWRTHYTPLNAIARLCSEPSLVLAPAPAEFLPRGFEVLLRDELFQEKNGLHRETEPERFDDLRRAVEKYGDLILLGDPGAGKTTTLWRLMYDYAQADSVDKHARLPVLLSLGRYDGITAILDFVRAELILASGSGSGRTVFPAHLRLAAHLDEYFNDGRFILLFDAVNEMPQAHNSESIRRLETFRKSQGHNRFVFTCRALDYSIKLDLPEATIQDLDEEAERDFLFAYFSNLGLALFAMLHTSHPDLLDIGRNPYMLLMLGQVHQLEGELPRNRGLLIQSFVKTIFERERQIHLDNWIDIKIQNLVLSDLALAMQRDHRLGTSVPREWVDRYVTGNANISGNWVTYRPGGLLYLARSASLLEEFSDGSLRFAHQLLQEYFAATALYREGFTSQLRDEELSPQWDEVLVLLAGLMANATTLIEQLLPFDPYLSARCAGAAQSVSSHVSEVLIARLLEELGNQPQTKGPYPLSPDVRAATVRALGKTKFQALVPFLTGLLDDQDWTVREAAVKALGEMKAKDAIPNLVVRLKDEVYYVRKSAAEALGALNAEEAIPDIVLMLNEANNDVRTAAATALGSLKANASVGDLASLLQDRDWAVREAAIGALSVLDLKVTLPHILSNLRGKGEDVHHAAVRVLRKANSELAISYLIGFLHDQDSSTRVAAREALKLIVTGKHLPLVTALLSDDNHIIRKAAMDIIEATKQLSITTAGDITQG